MNKTASPQLDLSDVILSWSASCSEGASDYGIYQGTIGVFYSHTSVDCNDGGAPLTEQITPAAQEAAVGAGADILVAPWPLPRFTSSTRRA